MRVNSPGVAKNTTACPWTPLPSAANIRSVHTEASTHDHSRPPVSATCLALPDTVAAALALCLNINFASPPSCPASLRAGLLPAPLAPLRLTLRQGYAPPALRRDVSANAAFTIQSTYRYYQGSDSCAGSPPTQVSPLTARYLPGVPSPNTSGNPVSVCFAILNVTGDFPSFALNPQARCRPPPNRVRCLQTASSSSVALHLTSQ